MMTQKPIRAPSFKVKKIDTGAVTLDEIPAILEANEEPNYVVCGVMPHGYMLAVFYRRV